jgi:indoleacetamide hydrolase
MNRRLVLQMLAAIPVSDFTASAAAGPEAPILTIDCADLVARIRDGSLRAEQVCACFLAQYERQRSLNAVTSIDPSSVLAHARDVDRARDKGARLPALAGLPILVKDNIDTLGLPTTAGTPSLERYFPRSNALVIERLSRQGAIVLGKANMHELAGGVTSSNPTFGFVRNPYNPDLIPGGSSGGCAAAIAARIVPAALGTDTGGSVRIPAAFCGTVGFRPSVFPLKSYSQQGVVPLSLDLDTIGPMGRCVADVALLHGAIVGQRTVRPGSLEKVRIGVPRRAYWDELEPEVERVAQAALSRLRDHGAVLVEIDLHDVKQAALEIFPALFHLRALRDMENFLRTQVPSVSLRELTEQIASRDVRVMMKQIEHTDADRHLLNAQAAGRAAHCTAYRTVFQRHDIAAVVFPTVVLSPPPIRALGDDADETIEFNGQVVSQHATVAHNTIVAAGLGVPGLSLPAGLTRNGLPVALEFDGLAGDDSILLSLGLAAEAALGRLPAPGPVQTHLTAATVGE